jgi:hypothetical protein
LQICCHWLLDDIAIKSEVERGGEKKGIEYRQRIGKLRILMAKVEHWNFQRDALPIDTTL